MNTKFLIIDCVLLIIANIWLASGRKTELFVVIVLNTWILALIMLLFPPPAHADDGPVAAVIGGIISAMQPTSTSPDNTSYGDDGDDD